MCGDRRNDANDPTATLSTGFCAVHMADALRLTERMKCRSSGGVELFFDRALRTFDDCGVNIVERNTNKFLIPPDYPAMAPDRAVCQEQDECVG